VKHECHIFGGISSPAGASHAVAVPNTNTDLNANDQPRANTNTDTDAYGYGNTAATPKLGNYADTSVSLSGDTDDHAVGTPANTTSINVSTNSNFRVRFAVSRRRVSLQ